MDNASDSGGVRFTDFNPVRTNGHVIFGAPLVGGLVGLDLRREARVQRVGPLRAAVRPGPPLHVRRRRAVEGLVGGWSLSGVGRIQGGAPLVLSSATTTGSASRATCARSGRISCPACRSTTRASRDCPVGQKCEPYFNPAAFMRPAKGTLGDAPRTIDEARWPTMHFFDLSIQKNFNLASRQRRLQLRVDAINAFNHPVFKAGRDSDNGEIFALPAEGLLSTAQFNAWADFNGRPRAGTPAGDRAARAVRSDHRRRPAAGTPGPAAGLLPRPGARRVSLDGRERVRHHDGEGLKLYRLRQAYTPDRWGYLGARSPYTPRFVQIAVKIYF